MAKAGDVGGRGRATAGGGFGVVEAAAGVALAFAACAALAWAGGVGPVVPWRGFAPAAPAASGVGLR